MESLSEEIWDVVIAGTSLPQSLLALSLSRANKKVLQVDRNSYYGGNDAGFSLQDARDWVKDVKTGISTVFADASIDEPHTGPEGQQSSLKASRAYTLSLNPQIIYAQSDFLPTLVSSLIHSQLEFLAVGSWWVYRDGAIHRIPSTREDVFNDESLSMRDKRGLMKFLRFVLQEENQTEAQLPRTGQETLADALKSKFKVPPTLEAPILALALSLKAANEISLDEAVARIRRHMQSVGYFGPGFGAVIAKYGGNAEISQVACRAQAVNGGVYLLGHGVHAIDACSDAEQAAPSDSARLAQVTLSNGTKVRSRWVVGGSDDLPRRTEAQHHEYMSTFHSIDVVSNSMKSLFPATSENGPVPAVAIILVEDGSNDITSPVYLQVHSEDTGECPAGQCIIYGSLQSAEPRARDRLREAVSKLMQCTTSRSKAQSIWGMSYVSHGPATFQPFKRKGPEMAMNRVVTLSTRPQDISLQDETLDDVKNLWSAILGSEAEQQMFLRFEEREQESSVEG